MATCCLALKNIVAEAMHQAALRRHDSLPRKDVLQSMLFDYFDQFYADKEALTTRLTLVNAKPSTWGAMMCLPSTVIKSMATSFPVLFWTKRSVLSVKILTQALTTPDDYAATVWIPPIRANCRCIWVAIMEDRNRQAWVYRPAGYAWRTTAPLLQRGPARLH